jgi:uncharacterized protein
MINPEDKILNQIVQIALQVDPKAKVYLYGSRIKGTASRDSDWDVLILVSSKKLTPEMELQFTYPLQNLSFDSGQVITPVIYTEKDWKTIHKGTAFYENVMKLGKLL